MPDIRRPRSNFRNRVNKMQGLPIDEKSLLLRMGELVDTAVNNRQTTGPGADETVVGRQKRRRNRNVPQPINLTADVGTRGAILRWDKVDSPLLRNYRIRITPINDTGGAEFVATAFSNEYAFKGLGGEYKFEVQSIGRNGEGSEWSASIFFGISDTPIILEGNKFDVETLGAQISETVLTPLNYTAFVFASVVLDSFADPNNNPSVVLELRHGDTYENSVFVQEFDLYPESEDLNNFDNTMGISRPSGSPGRSATFNTTQSVMFTPYQILEGNPIADKNTRFWVTVTSHGEDVVGLSIAIWVASEGLSEETGDDDTTLQHIKSVQLPVGSAGGINRAFAISSDDEDTQNNIWSFNIWLKPSSITTPAGGFEIYGSYGVSLGAGNPPDNRTSAFIDYYPATPRLEVAQANQAGTVYVTWTKSGAANIWPLGVNNWHMLTVCFSGERAGSKFDVYVNGVAQVATTDDSTSTTIPQFTSLPTRVWAIGGQPLGNQINTVSGNGRINTFLLNGRVHQAGLWNVVLSQAAVQSIYNSGNGARRDWRNSFGAYGQALNMRHYWRFGGLENDRNGSIGNINEWVKKGGGTPTQAEVNTNVANDVSFDLGSMQDSGSQYDAIDFTNEIFISLSTPTSPLIVNRETLGGYGTFTTVRPDAGDIVDDYPGT